MCRNAKRLGGVCILGLIVNDEGVIRLNSCRFQGEAVDGRIGFGDACNSRVDDKIELASKAESSKVSV